MNMKTRALLAMAILTTTTACGGGGGGGGIGDDGIVRIDEAEQQTRTFATKENGDPQDAGGVLADGGTLTARKVGIVARLLNYDTGETGKTTGTASIVKNAIGGHDITLNGKVLSFATGQRKTEANGKIYGYKISDGDAQIYSSAFSQNGELDELLSPGNGYAEILSIQTNQIDPHGPDVEAYAVFGAETADAALKNLPTATYNGRARLDMVPNSGFVNNEESMLRLRSKMEMTADFGKGEVSGRLTDITEEAHFSGVETPITGTLLLNTAKFTSNGFAGSVSPDANFANNSGLTSATGSYSGAFYGPAAEEVAGTLAFSGTKDGGTAYNGIGFFAGE